MHLNIHAHIEEYNSNLSCESKYVQYTPNPGCGCVATSPRPGVPGVWGRDSHAPTPQGWVYI